MTLALHFIDALAWLWGGLCALDLVVQLIPPIQRKDVQNAGEVVALGIVAWAWLIARSM